MDKAEHLRQAKILFASGQLKKSIAAFTRAEQSGCDTIDVWLSRGAAQMALGKYHEAKEDFTRILEQDAEHERAAYYRGVALDALGEYENAIKDLTSALIKNNNRGIAHLVRGVAYAELGQKQNAMLDINSASAFSDAELTSFKNLFGDIPLPLQNTEALLAEENAPWNNLLSKEAAGKLLNLLQ